MIENLSASTCAATLGSTVPPMGSAEEVKAILVEYETLHKMQQQVYEQYAKSLVLIVLAVGAIGAVLVNNTKDVKTDTIALLAILFTLLIDTWAAGWCYLHMELWAHRKYLETLESILRRRFENKTDDGPFTFYSGKMAGVYKVTLVGNWCRCHIALDVAFVFSCGVIYLLTLCLAATKGFDVAATLDVIPGRLRPFVGTVGRWLFVISSVSVLALAMWAWRRVVRVAKL
jgi:hypothetical protein